MSGSIDLNEELIAVVSRPEPADVRRRAAAVVALTKPKQTGLLLCTAAGSYVLSAAGAPRWTVMLPGLAALACAIAGCTALNMVLDRDIDARMGRTAERPIPSGTVTPGSAAAFGVALAAAGVAAAWWMGASFGAVVATGLVVDLLVYTAWLKRSTPWSIALGGVAGGVPALAGRVLAIGRVDVAGLMLAAAVLLWIPAHILTLAIRYADEYRAAGVPMWPVVYGAASARRVVAVSTAGAAAMLAGAGWVLGLGAPVVAVLAVMGSTLTALAAWALARPSLEHDGVLFKAASIYMAAAFGCLVVGGLL